MQPHTVFLLPLPPLMDLLYFVQYSLLLTQGRPRILATLVRKRLPRYSLHRPHDETVPVANRGISVGKKSIIEVGVTKNYW